MQVNAQPARVGWVIGSLSLLVVLLVGVLLLTPPGAFLRAVSLEQAEVAWLPRLNATLNGSSALLLAAGYVFIRRRQVKRHRLCMLTALSLSVLFLVSYVIYHTAAGSTRFAGPDWLRPVYLTILISHIVLAACLLPLALTTYYRARKRTFVRHRRIARWTLPVWFYVSVSGVLVYWLLYHWR